METFDTLVDESLQNLPEEFKEKMNNIDLFIEDWPTRNQLSAIRGRGGMLLGLYEGIPLTKRRYYGVGGQLPDRITIFRIPILRISKSEEDLKNHVYETVIHEIAHHFGLSDNDIYTARNHAKSSSSSS